VLPLKVKTPTTELRSRRNPNQVFFPELTMRHERVQGGLIFIDEDNGANGSLTGHVKVAEQREGTAGEDLMIYLLLLTPFDFLHELSALLTIKHEAFQLLYEFHAALAEDVRNDGDPWAPARGEMDAGFKEEHFHKGVRTAVEVCAHCVGNEAKASRSQHGRQKWNVPI